MNRSKQNRCSRKWNLRRWIFACLAWNPKINDWPNSISKTDAQNQKKSWPAFNLLIFSFHLNYMQTNERNKKLAQNLIIRLHVIFKRENERKKCRREKWDEKIASKQWRKIHFGWAHGFVSNSFKNLFFPQFFSIFYFPLYFSLLFSVFISTDRRHVDTECAMCNAKKSTRKRNKNKKPKWNERNHMKYRTQNKLTALLFILSERKMPYKS